MQTARVLVTSIQGRKAWIKSWIGALTGTEFLREREYLREREDLIEVLRGKGGLIEVQNVTED
jgi:hypothetical protein